MADAIKINYVLTNAVPVLYPNFHEAKKAKINGKEKGEPKFGGTFVFSSDNSDLPGLKKAAVQVARQAWPGVDLKTIKFPFKNGTTDTVNWKLDAGTRAFVADKALVKATSTFELKLSGIENGKVVDYTGDVRIAAKPKFYGGVEVYAEFILVPGEVDGKKYVTVYLSSVLTTGRGERRAGGKSAAEVFRGIVGLKTTEDPTAGMAGELDDEIPF